MKNISIWQNFGGKNFKYKELKSDITCDVLIIGGGITGISTLYYIDKSNLDVVLVEQQRIGMGVTSRSTGKLTYLQDSIYNEIIKRYGEEVACRYLNSQKDAVNLIVDVIKKERIDCDLVKSNSYVYTNNYDEVDDLSKLKIFLEKNNNKVMEKKLPFVKSKYMIGVKDTYLFNPLKFVRGIASKIKNGKIYEKTSIKRCKKTKSGYICYTTNNIINCKYVVIASHYPFFNIPFLFPIKGSLEKSYICSGKKNTNNVSLISYSNPYVSIRNYLDNIIYLSNSHIISKDIDDKKHFKELEKKVKDMKVDVEYMWSNIDIKTNDRLPYIGKINDNLYIGTGYNTWGLAGGFMAGYIISNLLNNLSCDYIDLFDPLRKIKGNVLEIAKNSYYNLLGIVNGFFYNDVYRKCPHMGCNLVYNETEKTWDCPCHGSRFSLNGECISGPSNKDITVNNTKK